MFVPVEETASAYGGGTTVRGPGLVARRFTLFAMRHAAFAALTLFGLAPVTAGAQTTGGSPGGIVPSGPNAPGVVNTANGIPQINITKPSGAGVSQNTYSQFDVQRPGVILNNSPVITNTQQAGQINGNPNFGPNDAARIILNQVSGSSPSQLRGYIEVAGSRASVVVANPSGIVVDGGGFINTSRGILTTGNPVFDAAGNLGGFNVTGGNITVQGDGFNAANIDQVDLIARAVQVNAALHANTLNAVTGANEVDYASLKTTATGGRGAAPDVSIDVSQFGGMYANRIRLVGTENGVGVNNAGSIVAQGGDLTLTTQGQLVQSGRATASGNVSVSADSVANSGTVYAQQDTAIMTAGALINSGTLAARQSLGATAGSIRSTGTLGAGVNDDGSVGQAGRLDVAASGQLDAIGQNVAGGDASLSGGSVNLAGSQTAANGSLTLDARTGDLNVSAATTSAQAAINARAAGTLMNDGGSLSGGSGVTLTAGGISNRDGQASAQGPLSVQSSGRIDNQGGELVSHGTVDVQGGAIANQAGTIQGAGAVTVAGASLDNSAGRITSLNGDGLSVATSGQIVNAAGTTAGGAQGGVIGGNGDVMVQGGNVVNRGVITAGANLGVNGQSVDNSGGALKAARAVTVNAGARLANAGGAIAGQTATVRATTLDNSSGTMQADALSLDATDLVNHGGALVAPDLTATIAGTLDNSGGRVEANRLALAAANLANRGGTVTQWSAAPMALSVSNRLDNSAGGVIQTNSTDLTLAPAELDNSGGTIAHAGTGTLTVTTGTLNNAAGTLATRGQATVSAGSLNNAGGTLSADRGITAAVTGNTDNTQGLVRSGASLTLTSGGALVNRGGAIQAGQVGDTSTLDLGAASLDNTDGLVSDLGAGTTTVQGGSQIVNSAGVFTGNGDVALGASLIENTQGGQIGGANVRARVGELDNRGGRIGNVASGDVGIVATGTVTNTGGEIGAARDLSVQAATLNGGGTYAAAGNLSLTMQGDFSVTSDYSFSAGNRLSFTLPGTFSNTAYLQTVHDLAIEAGAIVNMGTMAAGNWLGTHSGTLINTGALVGGSVSLAADGTLANVGPTAFIGASDASGTLELLAHDIENRDDTTSTDTQAQTAIYGLGNVVLAGGRDAAGNYTNASTLRNVSALIESAGDMALHADLVTNTRREMETSGYVNNVDTAWLESLGISMSGRTGQVGVRDPDSIGGVYIEPPHGGQWNSAYQFTTYEGVAVANTVTKISPAAQIVSGARIDASAVGTLQNYWSNVAAAGDIAMPGVLDQDSWRGRDTPGIIVTYSGQYHYNNYDNSEHDWQLPFGDAPFVTGRPGGYTQKGPADVREYKLPDYQSTFVSNGTLSGTGVSVNNTAGNASVPSLGLAPGQPVPGVSVGAPSGSAGGAATMVDPVIASATALNVLDNLTIPQGGMFRPSDAPDARYVIETNPAFTSQRAFLSSDYFFQQAGYDPTFIPKRLGDGFYEQQLVRNQITALTGRAVLGPYADLESMYEALLGTGAALVKSLDLPLGAGLSSEQVAQLSSNVILMETRVVEGREVLVPVVYLARASQENMNGPLIAAGNIDIRDAQSFVNSGTIRATDTMQVSGQQIDNAFGALQSGGLMALQTTGNVELTSANVKAGSLYMNAGGDLILDRATRTVSQVGEGGSTRVTTTLGPLAMVDVAGNAAIITGGNFEQNAGALSVGGNLGMQVGGDWNLGAQQTGEHKVVQRANGVSDTDINRSVGSSVTVGGVSAIGVGGDLTARGAQFDLGQGGTIAVQGNVTLGAASATSTVNSNSSGSDSHGRYAETLHQSDQVLTGTMLTGGDSLTVAVGKDLNIISSAISLDKGTATLAAVGDVNIGAATETHELNAHETHSHSNVVSGKQVASGIDATATYSVGSMVSADSVAIASGRDINVTGSNVVGTNDVVLQATRNVNITTSQDTVQSSTYHEEKETGLMSNGGLSVSVGSRSQTDRQQSASATNNGSVIGSIDGNVTVVAGNDVHATGSRLHAGNDLTLAGKSVTLDSAYETTSFAEQQQIRQAGVTVGVTNPVLSAVQTATQMAKAAQHVDGDPRLLALAAVTTGLAAKNAYDGAMSGDPMQAATSVGINISLGASKSDSQMQAQSSTAVGSTVSAGNNVIVAASGAGADSNINVIGSTISAGNNALLAAEGNVNLQAAQNTSSQHSNNSGSSASVGVSLTVGSRMGLAFTASVAGNRGHADGDSSTWTNTHVTAGNQLGIQSGGDTNLKGAVVSADQVLASVGGNLNIESLQDTDHYDSKQQSAGVSVSVCVPPLCYSNSSVAANFSQQKMNSDYAAVAEQSGIRAGDGGFQVEVKGNTDLKGGVIASSDQAVRDGVNSLTTGTLTVSDIDNHAHYSASQVGISGGYSFGGSGPDGGSDSGSGIGKDQKGKADNVNPVPGTELPKSDGGFVVAPPVVLGASGDASSTTKSGISGGTLTITDAAKQQQLTGQTVEETLANLNRDTSDTGGALAPIFDKEKIEAGFEITGQFINQVGTFVANRAKEADAAKQAANDPNLSPEQRAAAQAKADDLAKWEPGGAYRQVLTALTVAAGGNVTGGVGEFAQAATVAYIQQLGANGVKTLVNVLDGDRTPEGETARAALHAIVGCAGAAASSQACGAGAMGAATSSVLGSLLGSADNLSASEREARDNLVTSVVAGIASLSGTDVAAAAGAGKIEVENNQVGMVGGAAQQLPPGLPGYTAQQWGKGDGVITDNATELDPSLKAGTLVQPPSGPGLVDQLITSVKDKFGSIVDNILIATGNAPVPDATSGRETKGRTTQWEKQGGMPEANKDFDNLVPSNVRDFPNGGRVGQLPDGRTVVVRPNSSDGRPTLEIQDGKNKEKVRYGE